MQNSAKTLAQQIAKQMAQEPLEILKDVKEQVSSSEQPHESPQNSDEQKKQIETQNHLNDQLKSSHRLEALQREIEDIRKQDIFKDLQRRISEGEEITLDEYPELSVDQKQVLIAQMEAVRKQKYATQNISEVPSIHSKPSRRFGAGQKQQAQKEQTHVEKPVQSST